MMFWYLLYSMSNSRLWFEHISYTHQINWHKLSAIGHDREIIVGIIYNFDIGDYNSGVPLSWGRG